MVFGKFIGGLLGFITFGIFGLIIGIGVGHFFDRGLGSALGFNYGAERLRLQRLFFETSFQLMGHIAKSDGRISEEEIQQAENLMLKIGLTSEHRQEAIALFKQGAASDFQVESVISAFIDGGGRSHQLPIVLMEFLISMALADGVIHPAEQAILQKVATYLGINQRQFDQLIQMMQAQSNFRGYQQQASQPRVDELQQAYQALGVSADISDKDLKKTYRQLMSRHHPDKLMAQGVPEDMIKMATEKSQEIQSAYEVIKRSRQ